jgi:hypothetical protein
MSVYFQPLQTGDIELPSTDGNDLKRMLLFFSITHNAGIA